VSYTKPDAITFTAAEALLLHHAVRDLIVRHTLGQRPLPDDGFDPLHVKLVSFVRETKTCASQPYSPPSSADELIDTPGAAALLDCSQQWVRRIRDELDGRNVGGRWLFPRQTVVEYVERKAGQHK
jgi:hypothetical protein